MSQSTNRATLVFEVSVGVGEHWARSLFDEMAVARRPIEGGWPGTVREARTRVEAHFHAELQKRGMSPLRVDELTAASRFAYDKAKRDWLRFTRGA